VEVGAQEVLVEAVVQVGLELRQDLQFLQGLLTQSQLVRVVRVLLTLLIHKKDSILFFPQLLLLVAGRVELAWVEETEALAAVETLDQMVAQETKAGLAHLKEAMVEMVARHQETMAVVVGAVQLMQVQQEHQQLVATVEMGIHLLFLA